MITEIKLMTWLANAKCFEVIDFNPETCNFRHIGNNKNIKKKYTKYIEKEV